MTECQQYDALSFSFPRVQKVHFFRANSDLMLSHPFFVSDDSRAPTSFIIPLQSPAWSLRKRGSRAVYGVLLLAVSPYRACEGMGAGRLQIRGNPQHHFLLPRTGELLGVRHPRS